MNTCACSAKGKEWDKDSPEPLKECKQVSDVIINTFWNNHSKNDVEDRPQGDGAGGLKDNCTRTVQVRQRLDKTTPGCEEEKGKRLGG